MKENSVLEKYVTSKFYQLHLTSSEKTTSGVLRIICNDVLRKIQKGCKYFSMPVDVFHLILEYEIKRHVQETHHGSEKTTVSVVTLKTKISTFGSLSSEVKHQYLNLVFFFYFKRVQGQKGRNQLCILLSIKSFM